MRTIPVECLGCGVSRLAVADAHGRAAAGECPACGYVGWAPSHVLAGRLRRTDDADLPDRRLLLRIA